MRILHTADLHIGKVVNNFSMLEDQKYVLTQMVDMVREQNVQAFIIAGDVYDRPIPSAEAVAVFHQFIQALHETGVTIFCISGNHDSPERLSFAQEILGKHGVYFAGTYQDKCKQITLQDEYGPVVFTLMPFIKPALLQENSSQEAVAHMQTDLHPQTDLHSQTDIYSQKDLHSQTDIHSQKDWHMQTDLHPQTDAGATIKKEDVTRQVLVTHFFVTNAGKEPELSDSETHVAVGGLDNVDASLFEAYHYTALGHIHKPQNMHKEGQNPIVYAGSPLSYSFSECGQEKGVVLVELNQNGVAGIERLPLKPLHRMRKIRGHLEDLLTPALDEHLDKEDYLQVTLLNEEELIDPVGTLRGVYPNIMQLIFEKKEKEMAGEFTPVDALAGKTPSQLFEDFYMLLRDKEMDDARRNVIRDILEDLI